MSPFSQAKRLLSRPVRLPLGGVAGILVVALILGGGGFHLFVARDWGVPQTATGTIFWADVDGVNIGFKADDPNFKDEHGVGFSVAGVEWTDVDGTRHVDESLPDCVVPLEAGGPAELMYLDPRGPRGPGSATEIVHVRCLD